MKGCVWKMRLLLVILTLFMSSSVSSEGLRDIEIEGYYLGQSLLKTMSEKKIKDNYKPEYKGKTGEVIFVSLKLKNYKVYKTVLLGVLNDFDKSKYLPKKNKKFEIVSVQGNEFLDLENCLIKKQKLEKEFDSVLKYSKKISEKVTHSYDKSKKSFVYITLYKFKNGDLLELSCYDWSTRIETEMRWTDHLKVNISTKVYSELH